MLLVLAIEMPTLGQTWESYDLSGNSVAETWVYDDDGDGQLDRVLFDGDENRIVEMVLYVTVGRIVSLWMDRNEDGLYDSVLEPSYSASGFAWWSTLWVDNDQDARWEHIYYDGNADGRFELVANDTDDDGAADTYYYNVAPVGQSGADIVNNQIAVMMTMNTARAMGNGLLGNTHIPSL